MAPSSRKIAIAEGFHEENYLEVSMLGSREFSQRLCDFRRAATK